jgi:hypothetical protein
LLALRGGLITQTIDRCSFLHETTEVGMVTTVAVKDVGVGRGSDGQNKGEIEKESKFDHCHLERLNFVRRQKAVWEERRSVAE